MIPKIGGNHLQNLISMILLSVMLVVVNFTFLSCWQNVFREVKIKIKSIHKTYIPIVFTKWGYWQFWIGISFELYRFYFYKFFFMKIYTFVYLLSCESVSYQYYSTNKLDSPLFWRKESFTKLTKIMVNDGECDKLDLYVKKKINLNVVHIKI